VLVTRVTGDQLVIDTWVMSCRVLARSMEEFICNELLAVARSRKCNAIIGTYRPSAKNKLVAELYKRLGFNLVSEEWGVTTWRYEIEPAYTGWTAYVRLSENEREIENAV
jgi:predicted enzyme involved in methoxymalonyl-ACP biosynthesis